MRDFLTDGFGGLTVSYEVKAQGAVNSVRVEIRGVRHACRGESKKNSQGVLDFFEVSVIVKIIILFFFSKAEQEKFPHAD